MKRARGVLVRNGFEGRWSRTSRSGLQVRAIRGKRWGCHIVQRRCPTPRRGRFRNECPVRCRAERRRLPFPLSQTLTVTSAGRSANTMPSKARQLRHHHKWFPQSVCSFGSDADAPKTMRSARGAWRMPPRQTHGESVGRATPDSMWIIVVVLVAVKLHGLQGSRRRMKLISRSLMVFSAA